MTASSKSDGTHSNAAIKRAATEWVRSFSSIPQDIIVKLYESGDRIFEITPKGTCEADTLFPMWGTMWSFGENIANRWLDNKKNLHAMAKCGFRIYEQDDYGYIFGIDGAGYDFYEAHWIPLYLARGLKWHEVSPSGR